MGKTTQGARYGPRHIECLRVAFVPQKMFIVGRIAHLAS